MLNIFSRKGLNPSFLLPWGSNCREDGDGRYPAGCLLEGGTFLPTSASSFKNVNCEWRKALPCLDTVAQTPPKLSLSTLAAWIRFFCAQLSQWSTGRMLEVVRRCEVFGVTVTTPSRKAWEERKNSVIIVRLVWWTAKRALAAVHCVVKLKEMNVPLFGKLNPDWSVQRVRQEALVTSNVLKSKCIEMILNELKFYRQPFFQF